MYKKKPIRDTHEHMHGKALILKLFEIGAVRFGSFPLKNGSTSPIYIDLKVIFSHPKLFVALAEALHAQVKNNHFQLVCGAPYTALPLATAISIQHTIPMVLLHKDKSEYQALEAHRPKQPCLVVEDVISSGQSVLQTIAALEREGLSVEYIGVLIDREQGGRKRLEGLGYRLHALFTISSIVEALLAEALIDPVTAATVLAFLKE